LEIELLMKEYRQLSTAIIDAYTASVTQSYLQTIPLWRHVLHRMTSHALSTSSAISLLLSSGYTLQALVLLRIRIEQCIVNSYLIHEDEDIAFGPFVLHVPIARYLMSKDAVADSRISKNMPVSADFQRLRSEAADVQTKYFNDNNDNSDGNRDQFTRKWTNLDLRSMSIKRDKIVRQKSDTLIKDPLEISYLTFYKAANPIVHADCEGLSCDYLIDVKYKNGTIGTIGKPSWIPLIMLEQLFLDIVQCSETVSWLGVNSDNIWSTLYRRWNDLKTQDLG
jgi:hypothetical protein